MALISDVVDQNMLVSEAPLTFDLGSNLVRGARAILFRVLYLWCTLLGTLRHAPGLGMSTPLLDLDGSTFSPQQLQGLQSALESQALEVDFVAGCTVTLSPVGTSGTLIVAATVTLTDNKAYALEVSISAARLVLLNIGATQ